MVSWKLKQWPTFQGPYHSMKYFLFLAFQMTLHSSVTVGSCTSGNRGGYKSWQSLRVRVGESNMCVCVCCSCHVHVRTCMHVPHVYGGQRIICDSCLLCGSWGLNLGGEHLYLLSHLTCSAGAFEDCCLGYQPRIKWNVLRHARHYHQQEVSGSCNLRAVM